MSQDLRRERDGVAYETIAGATQYIAELEAENARLKSRIASVREAIMSGNHRIRWFLLEALDGTDV